jgi:hypothetical protein
MDCVGSVTVGTLDEMVGLIDRCATAYGGPGWVTLAATGGAAVLMIALLVGSIYLLTR